MSFLRRVTRSGRSETGPNPRLMWASGVHSPSTVCGSCNSGSSRPRSGVKYLTVGALTRLLRGQACDSSPARHQRPEAVRPPSLHPVAGHFLYSTETRPLNGNQAWAKGTIVAAANPNNDPARWYERSSREARRLRLVCQWLAGRHSRVSAPRRVARLSVHRRLRSVSARSRASSTSPRATSSMCRTAGSGRSHAFSAAARWRSASTSRSMRA
jgi:hypothetical protein